MKRARPLLYTFGAVFSAIFLVGLLVMPPVLDYAQRLYFTLQTDVNQRQVRAMQQFVRSRLAAGEDPERVVRDFRAAVAGTQTDRSYLCLIDREDARYLYHPDEALLGMPIKPEASFDPQHERGEEAQWRTLIERGETASGLLDLGPGMSPEIVYFSAVPGVDWAISSHVNTAVVDAELQALRNRLVHRGRSC